jgi:hypothetical protein
MLVPLLLNHPPKRAPREQWTSCRARFAALGLPVPSGLDGESFL